MYKISSYLLVLIAISACDTTVLGNNMSSQSSSPTSQVSTPILQDMAIDKKNLEQRDQSGATPLMRATHQNNIELAKALIEAGADVNAKDHIQDSPYLYAGARGLNEILELTLQNGADLKSINRYGGTALIPASERGHVDTVKRLIKAGVDVNHINHLGWTALLEAIILGNGSNQYQQIVAILIESGADVNLGDKNGVTPLQHAKQQGYREIIDLLTQAGAK